MIRDNPNLDPLNPRDYMKLKRIQNDLDLAIKTEEVITNNASSGAIAGLPPDNPPVKKRKKKTYAYGGIGSRKMWMKNKYT